MIDALNAIPIILLIVFIWFIGIFAAIFDCSGQTDMICVIAICAVLTFVLLAVFVMDTGESTYIGDSVAWWSHVSP